MRKKKSDIKILQEIENYAKSNIIVIMVILCLEMLAAFCAVGSAIYKVFYDSDSNIYLVSIFSIIVFGLIEILVGNLSTKKRNEYIRNCNEKILLQFIDIILKNKNMNKFQFSELKYIFIRGLFNWIEPRYEIYFKTNSLETNLRNKSITKKQFLLASIYRCISIHEYDINGTIYKTCIDSILEKYHIILTCNEYNGEDYILNCNEIEKEYRHLKEEAELNQVYSYNKQQNALEEWTEYCNNPKAIKITKIIMLISAIGIFGFQKIIPSDYVSDYFNLLAIFLLAIELGKKE
ncbi:MAG TPA: hypothetical protein DCY04_09785 [Eubacterium sp.]|nr:hypothetical protein [Eubacterium sp.]